eukprot:TRINITY_DN43865_c0_g2_i1.p1 TRINITY_DN43865_c0_g2~~TRINITY_DN43865_c0_g2_i1.p1  ORF type:complete len:132 (+),score=24.80 TRINITY_DN43865_c0_g2_i1:140-535(+)
MKAEDKAPVPSGQEVALLDEIFDLAEKINYQDSICLGLVTDLDRQLTRLDEKVTYASQWPVPILNIPFEESKPDGINNGDVFVESVPNLRDQVGACGIPFNRSLAERRQRVTRDLALIRNRAEDEEKADGE